MAFDTKFNLSNGKFEQLSGDTLTLSGATTISGQLNYSPSRTIDGDNQLVDRKWVQDNPPSYFSTLTAETLTLKNLSEVFSQIDSMSTVHDWFVLNFGVSGDAFPNNNVTAAAMDENFAVFVMSTMGSGFYILDFLQFTTAVYNSSSGNYSGDPLPDNITHFVWVGDTLYYCTPDFSGFGRFIYSTLTNEIFTPTSGNYTGTIQNFSCTNLVYDNQNGNNVYFIVSAHGIARYTISTNTAVRYDVSKDNYSGDTLNQATRNIAVANNRIWITTATAGLFRFNPANTTMTRFATTSGNYGGEAFTSNSFGPLLAVGTDLYFSINKFDTVAVSNRRMIQGRDYTGAAYVLGQNPILTTDQTAFYSTSPIGFYKFNLITNVNLSISEVSGYFNDLSSSYVIWADPNGSVFDGSWIQFSTDISSNGVGMVTAVPSPFEIEFDAFGLKYTSDQSSNFGDRNLVDKGFIKSSVMSGFTSGGIINYADNYSGSYTPRSLVDKAFVTGYTQTVLPGASNGVKKVGNEYQLGGGGVSDLNGEGLAFLSTNPNGSFSAIITNAGTNTDTQIRVEKTGGEFKSTMSATRATGTTVNNRFSVGINGIVVAGFTDFKGIQYDVDYQANFTKRSIPDIDWVTGNTEALTDIIKLTVNTTLIRTDRLIAVSTTGSSVTITLPSSAGNHERHTIKDLGHAATNNITISGNGINIDGSPTSVINTNYGLVEVVYSGSENKWLIISKI